MTDIKKFNIEKLELDNQNPRLSEFGINEKSSQEEILEILWDEMAVNELMYSIVSNGFWDYEPLVIMKKPRVDKYIVLEGNRRLAAVMLIHKPKLISGKIPEEIREKIISNPKILESTIEIPIIDVPTRDKAWEFIGFKHVNGPAKWGSFAKAKYIAEVHNDFDVSLDDIAYQIGDTNKTVQRLYQGLMVLDQAERIGVYKLEDIQASRVYFSHLYTGLQREGIINFLSLKDPKEESKDPVPDSKKQELGQLLEWLYGSKRNETFAVIKSQNPDLKHLDEVLQSREATIALTGGEPLSYAYELSRGADALFEEKLVDAKRSLQKARAYLTTGYDGKESLLRVAGSVADLADDLYDEMEKAMLKKQGKIKKTRLTE